MGAKSSREESDSSVDIAATTTPGKKESTATTDTTMDLPADPEQLKKLRKKFWTKKRLLLHLLFWVLSLYNLVTGICSIHYPSLQVSSHPSSSSSFSLFCPVSGCRLLVLLQVV